MAGGREQGAGGETTDDKCPMPNAQCPITHDPFPIFIITCLAVERIERSLPLTTVKSNI